MPVPRTALPLLLALVVSLMGPDWRQGIVHAEAAGRRDVPDFPAELRRKRPVRDINDAVVYTVHETIQDAADMALVRKVGSDVLVRGWFKWHNARDYAARAAHVRQAHALGALFGGGITCSALYDGENGLTDEQVRDMATRGPDGKLVNAWGQAGTRHGTLSNPRYLAYLLGWCRRQIDAGADYLFMDEINAALGANEGFDEYSTGDFRAFLVREFCDKKHWSPTDARWKTQFGIDLADRAVCPDATVRSFRYRAYLKARDFVRNPHAPGNPLSGLWHTFRRERDDRAWKWLTDRIRAYAASKGRRVYISANGLARYVDLQVLGVWGRWQTDDGRVDLRESQMNTWASLVRAGRALAGRKVPVVLFHDWGFGGYPWLNVPPAERKLWMRVRGAEIYAAGGFFAFPVHGPWGGDAMRNGTIREIARQSAFYRRHGDLYRRADVLGFAPIECDQKQISLALWARKDPPALILHAINRRRTGQALAVRKDVSVRLPVGRAPKAVRIISPDFSGEQAGKARLDGNTLTVTLPRLEAYSVVMLDYDTLPAARLDPPPIVPTQRWARPTHNTFPVLGNGMVENAWALNGLLQGMLHTHLRNPPTFLADLPKGGELRVEVGAVAMTGARIECLVDGASVGAHDLPDRDGKNAPGAREYDRTLTFAIPPGRHRVTLHNIGRDWASISRYSFRGQVRPWSAGTRDTPETGVKR